MTSRRVLAARLYASRWPPPASWLRTRSPRRHSATPHFLTAWPATALPLMTVATTALTVALVPAFSRLLERFSSLDRSWPAVFALSAAAHAAEFSHSMTPDGGSPWSSTCTWRAWAPCCLSGFWSLIAERFDPAGARATSIGRIAAAGTVGGILGSLTAERIATIIAPVGVLVYITILARPVRNWRDDD